MLAWSEFEMNARFTPDSSLELLDGCGGSRNFGVPAANRLCIAVFLLMVLLSACQKTAVVSSAAVEDPDYAAQVALTDMSLSAEENFLGQRIVYLDGKITNQGPKMVQQVKVRLFFHDVLNQVVLREEHELFGARSALLGPGQTQAFQIRFDRTPDSWNQAAPQIQLVSLHTQQP